MIHKRHLFTLCVILLSLGKVCYAQIDSASIRIPQLMALQDNQNLVSKAIDGAVYLVRQEYLLESASGERLGRGILSYFGKEYSIGVLVDRDLWIPSYVREPWVNDPNFEEYENEYEPICSYTKIKQINSEKDYRAFEIKDINLSNALTSFQPGVRGLNATDSLPQKVKLQLYYVEANETPDESQIKSTTIHLNALKWDKQGKAEIDDLRFKDRMVLGGAVFTEKVSLGRIDIELVALYTQEKDNWILQSVSPILLKNNTN
ncbi:hypothetical protein [Catalinimonas niigatensis]|uniref:hypothetical protein n=1 Tax=Catalinimonas niigatensis TaxID=1397264 RepID=UPI002666DE92|nr:hypothetical protein [Catalinimonas niigatensis]WPP49135.1 hypothetical protein PZB72_20930 [Catalinimonas niigatensis]